MAVRGAILRQVALVLTLAAVAGASSARKLIPTAPSLGPADAPVTIVEYSDFQCPFCARSRAAMRQVLQAYEGRVRWEFRHFPLDVHPQAPLAHEAALAADAQGRFWDMHDALFANQSAFERGDLVGHARRLGLDVAAFEAALDTRVHRAAVQADLREGAERGVGATPTFYVNGERLVGAREFEDFRRLIEGALAASGAVAAGDGGGRSAPRPVLTTATAAAVSLASATAPALGPPDAPVTIVEYSDFQCPFCAAATATLRALLARYPGQLRWEFRHFPLDVHTQARRAHALALAAHEQGAFWPVHDLLFALPGAVDEEDVLARAGEMGLDVERMRASLASGRAEDIIEQDLAEGRSLGVTATPTFFVNGHRLVGSRPLAVFSQMVERALAGLPPQVAPVAAPVADAPPSPEALEPADSPALGEPSAPVTIVEYADFQCPFCARASATMHALMARYPGRLRWVFKHFPLDIHPDATLVHAASLAAHEQGRFWEMHDLLYAQRRSTLQRTDLLAHARHLGLDGSRFLAAIESEAVAARVQRDRELGRAVGVNATPTFFVGGVKVEGSQPLGRFVQLVEEALRRAGSEPTLAPERVATSLGAEKSPMQVVLYADFDSALSAEAAWGMRRLQMDHPELVRIEFRSFPLERSAANLRRHEAALAAGAQGRFWEMHDLLFASGGGVGASQLADLARTLGLDLDRFERDLASGRFRRQVEDDAQAGLRQDVRGVPTLFVNGTVVDGVPVPGAWQEWVRSARRGALGDAG